MPGLFPATHLQSFCYPHCFGCPPILAYSVVTARCMCRGFVSLLPYRCYFQCRVLPLLSGAPRYPCGAFPCYTFPCHRLQSLCSLLVFFGTLRHVLTSIQGALIAFAFYAYQTHGALLACPALACMHLPE